MIHLPSKSQTASFDVDCQKTFTPLCPQELPIPEGNDIVPALNAQALLASKRIASKEGHSPHAIWIATQNNPVLSAINGSDVDVRWPQHAVAGTLGFELLDGLPAITDYDYVVWKGIELDLHPYGSCYHDLKQKLSTGVIEFLRQHGILTVIVGGLATDYCVKTTVFQLKNAQFDVILNLAATRGLTQKSTDYAIQEMRAAGVKIAESLADLQRP